MPPKSGQDGSALRTSTQGAIIDLVLLLTSCGLALVSLVGALWVRPARYPAAADVGRDRLAYLAGGHTRVINAALAELVARGTVTISSARRIQVVPSGPEARGPVESTIVEAARDSPDGLEVHLPHEVVTADDIERLVGKGWVTEQATRRSRRLLAVTAGVASLGLAGTLVLLGLRLVPAEVLAWSATGVFALTAAVSLAGRRFAGRVSRLLDEARLAYSPGEPPARPSPETIGWGVALHGLRELPDRRARAALGHRPRPTPPPVRHSRRRTRSGGRYPWDSMSGDTTGGWGDSGGGGGDGGGGGGGGGD
ncbi:TIGR04222 domain-containing membrane protein [Nonomuraea sp. NPDC059194]|uniref:TIGR04222 domain-containing membrane protein n=1 Tax=Nonomuraea sp. NPDC059194 TaxID=3346764 RepID=UPI0036B6590C